MAHTTTPRAHTHAKKAQKKKKAKKSKFTQQTVCIREREKTKVLKSKYA